MFLSSCLVHLEFALGFALGFLLGHSWFALGLFSTGIYSSLVILAAHLLWVCCSLVFTLDLLASVPNLFVQAFLQVFLWFAPGSFKVCSGSILHLEILTLVF